jgi:hypothetical protein
MKSYLSRIAARAGGTPVNESNHIKPIIRQWSVGETAPNSSPFEEINKPINPVQNTGPLHIDKKPGDMIFNKQTPLKHTPPAHDVTPSTPTGPVISHTVKQPEMSRQQENVVLKPPASHEKIEISNGDKPVVEVKQEKIADPFKRGAADIITPEITGPIKPEMADTLKPEITDPIEPEMAESIKAGKADTAKPGDIKKTAGPVSTATRFIHRQVSIQNMEEKRPVKEQVIGETTKPVKEVVRLGPVSELRPVSPKNSVKFIPLKKESKEPRLVIGRLNVEVITPQPVKTQPAKVRTVTKVKESHKTGDWKGFHSKMQFGLGQI